MNAQTVIPSDRVYAVTQNILDRLRAEPRKLAHYTALYSACKGMENGVTKWQTTDMLKRYCVAQMRDGHPDAKEINAIFRAALLLEAQGLRFDSYMQYIELQREPEKKFWMPRRERLLPIVNDIQNLIDDKLDLLTISLPPGTGKSTLEIFLLSMVVGAFPDSHSLTAGCAGMGDSLYSGVTGILNDSDEYLWRDVFPDAGGIFTNAQDGTIDVGKRHRFSTLTCKNVGQTITGSTRCDQLLCCDDLVEGIEQALSPTRLEKLWKYYSTDLTGRIEGNCKELHCATRWSVRDPIGRIEGLYSSNGRYKFVIVPDINELTGESNFNYKYGKGFSIEKFQKRREMINDDITYNALYKGRPVEREGILYNGDELKRYFALPPTPPDAVIGICDTKDAGADFAVLLVAYIYGDSYYIEDCICDDGDEEKIERDMRDILVRHKVQVCQFESNSAGGVISRNVDRLVKEVGGNTSIRTKYTMLNKETKIITRAPWVKEHCLFKDVATYATGSVYGKMMGMLCSYTQKGKNAHDDVPDVVAMLADFADELIGTQVQVIRRPY